MMPLSWGRTWEERTEVVAKLGRGAGVADAVAPAAESDGSLDVDALHVCGDVGLEEVDGFGDRDRDRHEHEELLRDGSVGS